MPGTDQGLAEGVAMAALEYSVYVAPAKPAVSDDLPPGEDRRMWSPTASTLIRGVRDAVLVDALMTKDESRALADWVAGTGSQSLKLRIAHSGETDMVPVDERPPQIPNDIMSLIGQRSRCPVARNLAMSSSAVCID